VRLRGYPHERSALTLTLTLTLTQVAKGDELKEAVPEALKNILLVMASLGLLTPAAPGGLWDLTWKAAAAISPTLEAESLLNN